KKKKKKNRCEKRISKQEAITQKEFTFNERTIWSEEAKAMMKQWAQKAGISSQSVSNQLLILLEPECASMRVILEMKEKQHDVQFNTGDCYMMMDLGAGTADTVCHEIIGPFEVREMIASFGGPWGSSCIDRDVETVFRQMVGKDVMDLFQTTYPKAYLQLLDNIEHSKQRFFLNENINGNHRIEIPREFDKFMREKISDTLQELVSNFKYQGISKLMFLYLLKRHITYILIKKYNHNNNNRHLYDGADLSLSCKLWMKLFDLRIDPIIEQMDKMLKKNEKILGNRLKYICLVGGFSQSPYLQYKLKQHYESKYTFVISKDPLFSVVEGAAQLARIPSFITFRIVKYTYGTGTCWRLEKARPAVSPEHIQNHKFLRDIDNEEYVDECFRSFVKKGEKVQVGQMTERSFTKPSKDKENTYVAIYRSEEHNPSVTTKCKCLGVIEIPFPKDFDDVKDCFYVRFYFGETMIRVTVCIKGKEYIEYEKKINFDVQPLYCSLCILFLLVRFLFLQFSNVFAFIKQYSSLKLGMCLLINTLKKTFEMSMWIVITN
ncbi:hypothetical protein RFI_24316, partial [Reticulomyxa filosa]